jgi:hypothetical protein
LRELVAISSSEQATDWARKSLPAKNTLAVADAEVVEQAFERRLTGLNETADAEAEPPSDQRQGSAPAERLGDPAGIGAIQPPGAAVVVKSEAASHRPPPGIDKSVLTLPEPKRHRNKEHLRFVAQQPCLICGRTPSDPHHLRFAQQRALGRKVSDEFVVPLCRSHHRALHRVGNEPGWWQAARIDPLNVARKLWGQSRMVEQAESDAVQAASQSLLVAAGPQTAPPSQALRRGGRRITKGSARAPANDRPA